MRRHFSGDFRFWPLLLSPYWPPGRYISDLPGAAVFHVDELYRAQCSAGGVAVFQTSLNRGALSSSVVLVEQAVLLDRDPSGAYRAALLDASNCSDLLPAKLRLQPA